MTAPLFVIDELHVAAPIREASGSGQGDRIEILKGVSLTILAGEIHVLMGPRDSGTCALAAALLGSPDLDVTSGRILFKGDDITDWSPDVRAKAGVFLAFQYPQEIAGVSVLNFLRQALSARKGIEMSVLELRLALLDWMKILSMDTSFIERYVNEGFSDGEKKRNEVLQMAVLEPEMAILDEIDTGLDARSLVELAAGLRAVRSARPELGILAVTQGQRLLEHLEPDHLHVLDNGRLVASGGPDLAHRLERDVYESFR